MILCGRISTAHQDIESNAAQHEEAERYLEREYAGPREIKRISDQGSGWLADRPGINLAQHLIAEGWCDLVLVNEIREVYRNPRFLWAFVQDCVDNGTRFISIADAIDTAEENWEPLMHMACLRHGMAVPEARQRVKRKATLSFSGGGMVMKVQYGYRKLTAEESLSGVFGPVGLRIAKLEAATSTIQTMKDMVVAGKSYEIVAEWLTEEGVAPGPYATNGKWTGRLVRDLLRAPILSGQRQFRRFLCDMKYGTGKHKLKANPKPPESIEYSGLAHLTPEQHQELLAVMDARKEVSRIGHPSGRASTLYNVLRSRSLWPGQHLTCAICGGLFYCFGEVMKCQNARGKGPNDCWNRVQVREDEVHEKVLPVLLRFLLKNEAVRKVIAEVAWKEHQRSMNRNNQSLSGLVSRISELERQATHLAKAIAEGISLEAVSKEAKTVEEELCLLRKKRAKVNQDHDSVGEFDSPAKMAVELE